MTVRVAELLKDYKGNELRGDNRYKGKRIRVFGKVGDIKRDIAGSIFVTIGTGAEFEIPQAQAFFGEEYISQASSLNKGNNVLVNCDVDGLMMNVLLKDCSFPNVDAYNACAALETAGIVTSCIQNQWTEDELVPFITTAWPANVSEEKAKDLGERTLGMVSRQKDAERYATFTGNLSKKADGGFGNSFIGFPAQLVVAILPVKAPPTLKPRVKAVLDKLPAAKN